MAATSFRVLELLRDAEKSPLSVRHVFECLGGNSVCAGDLPNSLRFFATCLQRLLDLRGGPEDEATRIVSDVHSVHAWIRHGAAIRKDAGVTAKHRFDDEVYELMIEGLCVEEIFGDGPLGEEMHTRGLLMLTQVKLAELWAAYEPVANQYRRACDALLGRGQRMEAFVDVPYLPLLEGQCFPAFVKMLNDEVAARITFKISTSLWDLAICPHSGSGGIIGTEAEIRLSGGVLETFRDSRFEQFPRTGKVCFSVHYESCPSFLPPRAFARVEKTPKGATLVCSLELDKADEFPILRIVQKGDSIRYGFCSTGRFTDIDLWVPRRLVMALI